MKESLKKQLPYLTLGITLNLSITRHERAISSSIDDCYHLRGLDTKTEVEICKESADENDKTFDLRSVFVEDWFQELRRRKYQGEELKDIDCVEDIDIINCLHDILKKINIGMIEKKFKIIDLRAKELINKERTSFKNIFFKSLPFLNWMQESG